MAQPVSKVMTRKEIEARYGYDGDDAPCVYCGTYYKYNCGSLYGTWLDLTKFYDYDDFIGVCKELHHDERDPELMFQDFMNFPRDLYCESCMGEDIFDKIIEYANLAEQEREAFKDYLDMGHPFDIETFRERLCGEWNSEKEFAEHIVDSCYNLEEMMGSMYHYFDYDAYARDLFIEDFEMSENHYVFRRY